MPEIVRCPNCEQETYAGLYECPHCNKTMPPHVSHGAEPRKPVPQQPVLSWGGRLVAVLLVMLFGFVVKVLLFG